MRRRTLLAGLLAAPLAAPALAEAWRRISLLHSGFPTRTPIDLLFEQLRMLGYEDGRTATIELYGAEGNGDRLNEIVAQLKARPPDVIVAITSPAALALKRAGVTVPVVFIFVTDPVGLGIVGSLAHPAGNFTGLTYGEAGLGGKRLELLLDALPQTRRVAVLWGRGFAEGGAMVESIRSTAAALGISIDSREIRDAEDLAPAFAAAKAAGGQAVIFQTDNLMFGHREEIAQLALANRLPSIHSYPPEVRDGGLMSYGPDLAESYGRAAALVDRILKGARPADLPVEEPTRFMLAINLKTAAALGITIPPALLARAEEVIE
jgi:putative ABC transport system substrate-binding protein